MSFAEAGDEAGARIGGRRRVWRFAAAVVGLLACGVGTWGAGRAGYSRLLAKTLPVGGGYVSSAVDSEGAASFGVEIPATGDYVIWCRVQARSPRTDSFYVSVDGGPEDIFDVAWAAWSESWFWAPVNGRAGGAPLAVNPRVFGLAAGPHNLTFRAREGGARLSQLVVTDDRGFIPQYEYDSPVPLTTSERASVYLSIGASAGVLTPPMRLNAGETNREALLALAERPVRLTPADPEAHSARAAALSELGMAAEGIEELRAAAGLRPRDYQLWLMLGRARERAGMTESALAAFAQAVQLAPNYALPRWRLGRLLLRAGRREEAFAELRRAAASDESLLPPTISLAWEAHGGDAVAVLRAVSPRTARSRLALARFFIKYDKVGEAGELLGSAGEVASEERRALVANLLAAKRFTEAYRVWAAGRGADGPGLLDGGFEEAKAGHFGETGFGWKVADVGAAVRASVETRGPRSGAGSLQLEFGGSANPAVALISQILLVEPGTRYRLEFAARTQELVTGGAPLVTVTDAGRKESVLGKSGPLPQGTSGWHAYQVEFTTSGAVQAIEVAVTRQACGQEPCPIFGRAWLDDFALHKL